PCTGRAGGRRAQRGGFGKIREQGWHGAVDLVISLFGRAGRRRQVGVRGTADPPVQTTASDRPGAPNSGASRRNSVQPAGEGERPMSLPVLPRDPVPRLFAPASRWRRPKPP